jgi:hypothetical protein
MRLLIILLLFSPALYGQGNILILGNHTNLCLQDSAKIINNDTLPNSLENYGVIMLFSSSTSKLNQTDIERIVQFVENGGGLYSGAEDWPLQAESNQVTNRLYKKESFGEYENQAAEPSRGSGNLKLDELDTIPSGNTTVAFPMDYRLKVEAWVEDQPLILSGELDKGRIIIDGGYSRFYCDQRNEVSDALLEMFLAYLFKR